jgi:hypothetical protein
MAPSPAFEEETTMRDFVFWTLAVGGTPLALALTGLAMGRLRDGIRGLVSILWFGVLASGTLLGVGASPARAQAPGTTSTAPTSAAPTPSYGPSAYTAPTAAYALPAPRYATPAYSAPAYANPAPRYATPAYSAPAYANPTPGYAYPDYTTPAPDYAPPAPAYAAPAPRYTDPGDYNAYSQALFGG